MSEDFQQLVRCPHCWAGEPSVWDDVLFHYAHPHPEGDKLKFCHEPWRERCRRCSGDVGCSCDAEDTSRSDSGDPLGGVS